MMKSGLSVDQIYQLRGCSDNQPHQSLDPAPGNFTDLAQIVCSVRKPVDVNPLLG